ncbi:hypothetical protein AB7W75_13095 [Providencia huaxiensis]|uniref:Fimbrial protein n=1 Tax=Providencia rettgeri TaxID=587 RepID=A0A427HQ53_PRORE|nr:MULTISPECIES: hypothetical protein [Providencia]ELR5073403.1 hypothetical protein [Providencia stuartii]ELR5217063.1 hypothetical protein [Providencia rettgeri]MBV2189281.1 hypothetical protein [Providencia rettgeri]UPS62594.1 hypothetical protein M0M83_18600 [Providencia rettgeri]
MSYVVPLKTLLSSVLLFGTVSISQAVTQNMPIHISGSFSATTAICHMSSNTVSSYRVLAVGRNRNIGQEIAPHKIELNIDCNTNAKAQLSFNAPSTSYSSHLFQTSSNAFGVKLSWQGEPIFPNESVAIAMTQNQKSYYLDAVLVRVAPNGPGDYGEHSFNIAGNLAVDYP